MPIGSLVCRNVAITLRRDEPDGVERALSSGDDLLLADRLAADVDRVVADRRLLSDLTVRQRLEREDLDQLFANADELLEAFEQKLLRE